ncbi:MAG: UDP-4-amino-4,6-dideoxy-N-acetyl-beta-L-altrosamine transaminase [Methanoregula sp.]
MKKTSKNKLAISGGTPIRNLQLPYGRQWLDDEDINAVVNVLKSDWLTTGPKVAEFERSFAETIGAKEAVTVSNGTAALHAAMYALGIGPGDEVIVSPMTFTASANCILYQGGIPVFADVDAKTLLIDPEQVKSKITSRTKAIIAVDYAGQPCDYDALNDIARSHNIHLVDDACHALGGYYKNKPVGSLADLNTFSLHPVKHITSGEGGVITTDNFPFAEKMRMFRSHGITSNPRQRELSDSWFYEMVDLGYNYRLTDFQCALAMNQLKKLSGWVKRRQEIAKRYDIAFSSIPEIAPLCLRKDVSHAYHLYVIRLNPEKMHTDRATIFKALRAEGIGVNVHYIPVHLHPFYQQKLGTKRGMCPAAEKAYEEIISIPIYPKMNEIDVNDVIKAVQKVICAFS